MVVTRSARWILCAVGVAIGLVAVRLNNGADEHARGATSARGAVALDTTRMASLAERELAVPTLDLTHLQHRATKDPIADLFTMRAWRESEGEEPQQETPAAAPPATPQAPPLPFAFLGKLLDGQTTIVFLSRGDRNYVARLGDRLDESYRVEEIGEQTMTLAYLPLGVRQSLAIGSAADLAPGVQADLANVPGPLAPDARPTHDQTKLVWNAPPKVEIGHEFTIEVGLPAGSEPRSGQVELVYDAMLLALLGGATRQEASGGSARRAVVDVIGPGFRGGQPTPTEVRFRVLAGRPANTQISIEKLSATITSGNALVLEGPKAHGLAIVEPSGARP